MRNLPLLVMIFIAMLFFSPVIGYAEVRSIVLEHAQARELVPVLEQLFAGEVRIAVSGNTVILRGDAAELADAAKIIEDLDVEREVLRVAVRQDSRSIDSGVHYGEDSTGAGKDGGLKRLGNASETVNQFVRVLDGGQAMITVGQEVPYTAEMAVWVGKYGGRGMARRIDFQSVETGFFVSPRLHGDQVLLEVTPYLREFAGDAAESSGARPVLFQEAMTRVPVPLGRWVDLAGHFYGGSDIGGDFVRFSTGQQTGQRAIQIRVDRESKSP
ncbi:secretin N-terminal domain-containing protein [Geoalkalibacter subterraneus]|jgi:type II secretory pathway component GspD/PulD (secretin)|nr:secretin N-terminal domain-containing protein [Geoalkalibacter subterraneus]